ncbi:hypothetical protein ACIO8H_35050 [Streptomyces sp. NPDC087226]|uniref:hypothetical protein n=1 Tax=Streptomyces sp. NPDC087226 TaxID=3365771 RepID=UPI0037FE2E72
MPTSTSLITRASSYMPGRGSVTVVSSTALTRRTARVDQPPASRTRCGLSHTQGPW